MTTKFAITFAGQGSQSIGMMAGFAGMPIVQRTFEEASDLLKLDLWKMVIEGPVETLAQTVNTQPVMLVAGVATFRAWKEVGGRDADIYAGHSLGEYTALVAAGAISFADAVPLVRFRAQSMQDAVPEGIGGIAAVLGLEVEQIRAVCVDAAQGEVLEAVNLNSPGQIVIAGHRTAVERGMALAKERGAKRALLLPMSVPSHCALMRPAAEKLAAYLRQVAVTVPLKPVIQNADVTAFASADAIRNALVEQLYRPVRWIETIQAIAAQGAMVVIECVPGKILTGLNKRIDGNLNCLAIADGAALNAAVEATR
ncbi:MAG TPA: ACP S-malonyltransferase [Usitatibacteraceae bacterium]